MSIKETVGTIKKVGLVVFFGGLLLIGGFGACNQYVGKIPLPFDPSPAPTPVNGKPDPSTVWGPLVIPSSNSVKGLELPKPQTINTSSKYITVTAKCNNEVKWMLTTKSGKPAEALVSKLTNSLLIFTSGLQGEDVVITAYSAVGTEPTDTAITVFRVSDKPGPVPDPKPDPNPIPASLPKTVHVTLVLDNSKPNPIAADVTTDKALRTWLEVAGHKYHELSIADAAKYNLVDDIHGKTPPILVLQVKEGGNLPEGRTIYVGQLISSQNVKDAVTANTAR